MDPGDGAVMTVIAGLFAFLCGYRKIVLFVRFVLFFGFGAVLAVVSGVSTFSAAVVLAVWVFWLVGVLGGVWYFFVAFGTVPLVVWWVGLHCCVADWAEMYLH